MQTKTETNVHSAFVVACAACNTFKLNLARQFGKQHADEYEFRTNAHDTNTAASREEYQQAKRRFIALRRTAMSQEAHA